MKRGGRYNMAGNFIPATEQPQPAPPQQQPSREEQVAKEMEAEDAMQVMDGIGDNKLFGKPTWMKPARKLSNKERRRRQNEHIRRLISPKNALMVLNELLPGEVTTNNFSVELTQQDPNFFTPESGNKFCATFTVEGVTYKGFGESKLAARNSCAEKAIRGMFLKKMSQSLTGSRESVGTDQDNGDPAGEDDQDTLPMIQVASFALHKLFTEWQCDGFSVPSLKPQPPPAPAHETMDTDMPSAKKAKKAKVKELPAGAENMHPAMLLTHMRAGPTAPVYHELGAEGTTPQNMLFTMGVTVDGTTYIGKASNKKEARKLAARSACEDIFHIKYPV